MSFVYRVYSILVYAYPRQFRREYVSEIHMLFCDSCRDALRSSERFPLPRLAARLATGWLATMLREHTAAMGSRMRGVSFKLLAAWAVTLLMYMLPNTNTAHACQLPRNRAVQEVRYGAAR